MKKRFIFMFILILAFSFSFTSSVYASELNRLAGETKYDTAVYIAQDGWTQSDNAVLAYGENFPDALSAAPLAKKFNAPILLTCGNNLQSVTKQGLSDLQVKNVFIVGGTAVIPASVEIELQAMGITLTRIAGYDRYETSLKIAQQIGSPSELIVTTGEDYPDALSIAPIAGLKQIPIILVPKDSISDKTKKYIASINVNKTYLIGDAGIINDGVCAQFSNPERIIGADKYERNIAINKKFASDFKSGSICVATGEGFADALSGAAYAAKINAPIILVHNTSPTVTKSYYQQCLKNINNTYVFGGTAVVSESLIRSLNDTFVSIQSQPAPITSLVSRSNSSELVEHALSLLGVPYVYGGTSRSGFDCSGYTQYVFKESGISLPRIAADQYRVGSSVEQTQLQSGDLVFFTTYALGASHVGIYIGGGAFVAASNSGVCISNLSDDYYASRYLGARRMN